MSQNKIEAILQSLEQKACKKQAIYRNTLSVFSSMKDQASRLADVLSNRFEDIDTNVVIQYKDISEFEFHIKFSGDLLIFNMGSNVVTLPHENIVFKSPYIAQDPTRAFFGSIMVYNFMADSLKYNRLHDKGYLMARMLINRDNHFYIEGVRQLAFLYPDIAKNQISDQILVSYIQDAMLLAMDQDLTAPPFQSIQVIPLGQKLANQAISAGNKVGFQMSYQGD